jgi:hypothetical protein
VYKKQMATIERDHPLNLITEYALGMLPEEEQDQFEQHIRHCLTCRQAVGREQQIEKQIRRTVETAFQPARGRLHVLRPEVRSRRGKGGASLYHQFAPVAVISLLLTVGLLIQLTGLNPLHPLFTPPMNKAIGSPTMTATPTQTPTATQASLRHSLDMSTGVGSNSAMPTPVETIAAIQSFHSPLPEAATPLTDYDATRPHAYAIESSRQQETPEARLIP